jgi:hypothetical protein
VGQLDQFAKDTFAQETAAVTHGAVVWQLPPELGMTEVRLDGLLRVVNPAPLAALAAPWSLLDQADELVPFLIARTGRPLDAFVGWVKTRRSIDWLLRMVEYLPMSTAARDDLRSYTFPKTDDPVIRARQRMIAEWALEATPELREEVVEEGRLQEARAALRGVLRVRQIALGADEEARVDACNDLDVLKRWLDQAVVAPTAAEALR